MSGHPVTATAEAVAAVGASIVVMGNHHHSTLVSVVTDSVLRHLPSHARVPSLHRRSRRSSVDQLGGAAAVDCVSGLRTLSPVMMMMIDAVLSPCSATVITESHKKAHRRNRTRTHTATS